MIFLAKVRCLAVQLRSKQAYYARISKSIFMILDQGTSQKAIESRLNFSENRPSITAENYLASTALQIRCE